jgi:2-(1,2-epoxy-1,2-dihydrophenyl)acetyl-CoA isomerase
MQETARSDLARALYAALAAGDRDRLDALLHPDFVGEIAEGMPFGIGGRHEGATAMRRNGWGGIGRHFTARAEPERFLEIGEERLLVTGRYRGEGKHGGAALDAAFAHLITFEGERVRALEQYTDTARWRDAASPLRTVRLDVADGVATLRLNRPEQGNAINEEMAADLEQAAMRIAETSSIRAVLIAGNGPNFTVGGDVNLFALTPREQLPHRLRRMIDAYHQAIERLIGIDAPIVAAVRGAAAGGGLGLLYATDVAIAADDSRFALGYGALGLTSDGGNTWFLPRMVGLRRAQELFLLNRRLSAQEALEFGLVSRVAPDAAVEAEAAAIAARLAAGPTRAHGAMRRMLRQSFETGLRDQLQAEKESIVSSGRTDDAAEGIAAFAARRRPQFRGE